MELRDSLGSAVDVLKKEEGILARPALQKDFWMAVRALLEDHHFQVLGILHVDGQLSRSLNPHRRATLDSNAELAE